MNLYKLFGEIQNLVVVWQTNIRDKHEDYHKKKSYIYFHYSIIHTVHG